MATLNNVNRATGTLVASAVDTVNLSGRARQISVVNHGTAADIYISLSPTVAPIVGGENYVIPAGTTGGPFWIEPSVYTRSDSITTTSGSNVVLDASIGGLDRGTLVTGAGIPANSFVGTTIDGVSFTLVDQNLSPVNATASGTVTGSIRAYQSVVQLISAGTPTYTVQ